MFSSKLLQASRILMANGTLKRPISLRYMSVDNTDTCVGYGKSPLAKCSKKVATGCRTPNASVKCVSLSMEVPCKKISAPSSSFLEKLQAQDVFKLQKNCRDECCCQAYLTSIRKPLQISFTDIKQIETKC